MGQDIAGYRDIVVSGQVLNDFEWRVVERRQAPAEFGLGPAFNAGDQKAQHIVEDLDLILAQPLSVMQEKIGHLSKGANPLLRRAVPDGVFEFGDYGMLLQDVPHVSFRLAPGTERGSEKVGKVAAIQAGHYSLPSYAPVKLGPRRNTRVVPRFLTPP